MKIFLTLFLLLFSFGTANAGMNFSMMTSKESRLLSNFERHVEDYIHGDDNMDYYWETQFANSLLLEDVQEILKSLRRGYDGDVAERMQALKEKHRNNQTKGSFVYAYSAPIGSSYENNCQDDLE